MAHGFRIAGGSYTAYISKAGSNANSGASPDLPKLTIETLSGGATTSIGAGTYRLVQNMALSTGSSTTRAVAGDGRVVFFGNNQFTFSNSSSGTHSMSNIIFEGFTSFTTSSNRTFNNCTFINIPNFIISGVAASSAVFNNCTFINVTTGPTSIGFLTLNSSTLIYGNSSLRGVGPFGNPYLHDDSQISITAASAANYNFGCINGLIKRDSETEYVSLEVFKQANPTFFVNAFSTNDPSLYPDGPGFNNFLQGDLSLKSSSPLIASGINGANVAGRNLGHGKYVKLINGNNNNHWLLSNPKLRIKDLILSASGETYVVDRAKVVNGENVKEGWVQSAPYMIVPGRLTSPVLNNHIGNIEANTSFLGPHPENMNVPDSNNGTPHPNNIVGNAGYNLSADRNPNRMTYLLRWSTSSIEPPVEDYDENGNLIPLTPEQVAKWDNGGRIPAGTFAEMTWSDRPRVDLNGNPTGSPLYVPPTTENAGQYNIAGVWYQERVVLRDDYRSDNIV
jgi:hypothetical protein